MRLRPFLAAIGVGLAGFGVFAAAGFWVILAGPVSAEPVQGLIWVDQAMWAEIGLVGAGTILGWITLAWEFRAGRHSRPTIRV